MNERCISCIGDRRVHCDLIRDDVAGKLALLAEFDNLCHGFGDILPACVVEAAGNLACIGCDTRIPALVVELNQSGAQ
jgi:hypothetical protein